MVPWYEWRSLINSSCSIQVQRGAGSTLHSFGGFAGSVNIHTMGTSKKSGYSINAAAGMYDTYKIGAEFNSGLFAGDLLSFSGRINYLSGNSWRQNTYYQGISYYFNLLYSPTKNQSLNLIFQGTPQFHTYAFYPQSALYFSKYGRSWNPHAFVLNTDSDLTKRENDGTSLSNIIVLSHIDKDKGGEVIRNGNVSFDNEVYHRPQLEMHHSWQINNGSHLQTTVFAAKGSGYDEMINNYYRIRRDGKGLMSMAAIAISKQYQYRAYNLNSHFGITSVFNTIWKAHRFSIGVQASSWQARHYGLILNTFGNREDSNEEKDNVRINIGSKNAIFREGDIYYDYTTKKPSLSAFINTAWKLSAFSIVTSLQYSNQRYDFKEAFPSANNISSPDGTYILTQNIEGGNNDRFVNNSEARYNLVNFSKTYNSFSPKLGINYNVNKNINIFLNYSRVFNEPDAAYIFYEGQPNDDLEMEISDDIELGLGFMYKTFDINLNAYRIYFDNKAFKIQDLTKANMPGYDYKGRRYVAIGTAIYQGIEMAANMRLSDKFNLGVTLSKMNNVWGANISEKAENQLGIKEGKINPGNPQFMLGGLVNYLSGPFYVSLSACYNKDYYILPSNEPVALEYDAETAEPIRSSSTLDNWLVFDMAIGWRQQLLGSSISLSLNIFNLLDTKYFQFGNKYGFIPGPERHTVFSFAIGL